MHQVPVVLPGKRGSIVRVSIVPSIWFVPQKLGLDDDTRRLSVLLREVDYRDGTGTPIERNSIVGDASTTSLPALAPYILLLLIAFALTLRRPVLGLGVLIVALPLGGDISLGPTTTNAFKVALLGFAAAMLINPRGWREAFSRSGVRSGVWLVAGSGILLALVAALSIHDASFHAPAIREVLKDLEYAAACLLTFAAFRCDPDTRLVRNAFATIAILVLFFALLQEHTGGSEGIYIAGHNVTRVAGLLDGPNQLAGWLEVVGPVLVATAALAASATNLLLPAVAAIVGILTFSRAGSVGLLVGMSITAMKSFTQRRMTLALVLGAALLLVAAIGWRALAHGDAGVDAGSFNGGLGSRSELWRAAIAMWRAHPLLGVGAGNYEFLLGKYGLIGISTHANSWYLQALAETGILGFLATIGVVAVSILTFARRVDLFGVAAFAASIAICLHGIFDDVLFYPKVGATWWILLGIACAWRPPARSDSEATPSQT
jgi:O-antigen ligase